MQGTSLYLFSNINSFRIFLSKIVVHKVFEMFIFSVVILSAVMMGLEEPLQNPEWKFAAFFNVTNNFITLIFVVELIMKVIV